MCCRRDEFQVKMIGPTAAESSFVDLISHLVLPLLVLTEGGGVNLQVFSRNLLHTSKEVPVLTAPLKDQSLVSPSYRNTPPAHVPP